MIISMSGYGNSGASAALDYLKGFSNINVFDKCELELIHEIDGISDLKYYLVYGKDRVACNAAIHRFLRNQKYGTTGKMLKKTLGSRYIDWYHNYTDELASIKWDGEISYYDPIDIAHYSKNHYIFLLQREVNDLIKKLGPRLSFPPRKERYFSILNEKEFNSITKKYLSSLFSLLNYDMEKPTIIDMLFSVTNPTQGMEYFDDAKTIIVNRDPRDLYVSSRMYPSHTRFMPIENVEQFAEYYRTIVNSFHEDENVYVVQYEDLVYKYFKTTEKMNAFLGINNRPDKEFVFFDPLISIRFTNRKELYNQYYDDIAFLERTLNEHLYNFDDCQNPNDDEYIQSIPRDKKYLGWK